MDQLLHLAVLKFAETHLPQILQLQLAHAGKQQVGALFRPQHRADEHQRHLRVGKTLFQPGQLGAALVAQRQIGAAADITAFQIPGGEPVADEMQFVVFQNRVLLFPELPEKDYKFMTKCAAARSLVNFGHNIYDAISRKATRYGAAAAPWAKRPS